MGTDKYAINRLEALDDISATHRRGTFMITHRAARAALIALVMSGHAAIAGETGIASEYSDLSHTASGKRHSARELVAAHRTLPFGTRVRVENLRSGRSVTVEIVDRGPFIRGRIIDLSTAAARRIGMSGLQRVRLSVAR